MERTLTRRNASSSFRILTTKAHGVLDYLVGMVLIVAPWLLGFGNIPSATYVPVVLGILALLYSLLTKYELGAVKIIPMRAHLALDMLSGVLLAVSPWLLGFSDYIFLPHLLLGIFEIIVASITRTAPYSSLDRLVEKTTRHRSADIVAKNPLID